MIQAAETSVPEVNETVRSPTDALNFVAAPWMPLIWRRVAWVSLAVLVVVRLVLGSNLPAATRAETAHSTGRCAAPLDRIARLRPPLNRGTGGPPAGDSA